MIEPPENLPGPEALHDEGHDRPPGRAQISETSNSPRSSRGGGPRTDEGKRRSRLNATKHGLTSRIPVMIGEDPDELAELHREFCERFEPADAAEEAAIDDIVNGVWRKRRASQHEAALMSEKVSTRFAGGRLVSQAEDLLDRLGCVIEAAYDFLNQLDDWDEFHTFNATEVENAIYLPLALCFRDSPPSDLRFPREPERWSQGEIWRWFQDAATHLGLTGARALIERSADSAREILDARRRRELDSSRTVASRIYGRGSGFELMLRYESKIDREITNGYKRLENLQRSRREASEERKRPA